MKKLWAIARYKIAWHLNALLVRRLWLLNGLGAQLTVVDQFGTPGDTLLTATICRHIKIRFPRLRINCVTRNPSLLETDPHISALNGPDSLFRLTFFYQRPDGPPFNILKPTLEHVGIRQYDYRARVYLRPEELAQGAGRLSELPQPIITFNAMSRERVKIWPEDYWRTLLRNLGQLGSLVQLGDNREPQFEGVTRFAGSLTMRESMAVLAHARLHLGPDSFLMHAANGLDVRSIIIFGGSRLPASLGYPQNINLETQIECSGCWIDISNGQTCPYDIKCMRLISPETVYRQAAGVLKNAVAVIE